MACHRRVPPSPRNRYRFAWVLIQKILASGSPPKMEETILAMAERGEVDDALVLLLQVRHCSVSIGWLATLCWNMAERYVVCCSAFLRVGSDLPLV